ncbi:MAG: hypothetical protein F4117_00515 [Acidimicrobiales bacterium]|nr:hypothetical protein [Acidimicrobiaceae bacterium]MXV88415.1 hypothetical protein [Acidimicrobiales bacterium]MXX43555.1 hypothetical protein [Acidimicrobiales bacterium]MYA27478.1 hypothetical protein [Acidimicrobiales bacterium]MYA83946.1 hypothetical protein [Acidimicrobiales bacterium]
MGTVLPLAALLEAELTVKLEADYTLHFDRYPLDIAGRAQAFRHLVESGTDTHHALAITGLLSTDH